MEEPSGEIGLAITEGIKAGVFRRAQRLNPAQAATWGRLAERHTRAAEGYLDDMLNRLGAGNAGSCSREEG